jgi:carbon storage regulator
VVEVEVAGIRSSAVRLRINAPREIAVHRREIHDAIQRSEPGGDSEV